MPEGSSSAATAFDVLGATELDQFARRYYLPNRPVVIRGLRDRYPLKIFRWSPDYFRPVMGDKEVPVLTTNTGFLSYERDVIQMPFSEFLSRSFARSETDGPRYYFKNSTALIPNGHDDSDEIVELAPYLRRSVMRNLWISGGGLTVGLHFDAAENLNFQLRGDKTFVLYPPGVRAFYPLPMFSQTAHISGVFREGPNPDLKRFPRFDPTRAIRIDMREGDALYLPAYWWHQVESLGTENVNLNFWWIPSVKKQILNWNQALRGHAQLLLRYLKFGSIVKAPPAKPAQ